MGDAQQLKRDILYAVYKMLRIDIDFERKCEYCFNRWTWQTQEGHFVCVQNQKEHRQAQRCSIEQCSQSVQK